MKTPKACRQCRDSKRKCTRLAQAAGEPCDQCQKRSLSCTGIFGSHPKTPSPAVLLPKQDLETRAEADTRTSHEDLGPADVSPGEAVVLVDYYLDKLHNRPASLFHPHRLRKQVRECSLNRALLLAICSMGSRFSPDEEIRAREISLMNESKRLLLADLENICLENVQTCIMIANLSAAHLKPSSEALFFRIAISMYQVMAIGAAAWPDDVIETEARRRTWWTLFMADRWSSSGLGLHRQIGDSGMAVDLPMDEAVFESLSPDATYLEVQWQPGIWAQMISLVQLFGPIQDLNRRSAQGNVDTKELEVAVASLSQQLANWEQILPVEMQMGQENLETHCRRGTGGPFVALHLGYHHYATLLYFRFLEPQPSMSCDTDHYRGKCKYHASSYSRLLSLARSRGDCEVVYFTVGHMAVVSSSVLLHTLLFGEEEDLDDARNAMNANFEAIIELSQYWPNTAPMIQRLVTFQNFCLLSTDSKTHQLDGWMVRFLIEHSLPLEEKDIQPVKSAMHLDVDSISARTQVLTEQGRYTAFGAEYSFVT